MGTLFIRYLLDILRYKACGDSGTVNLKGNGGSDLEVQPTNEVGSYWLLKRE